MPLTTPLSRADAIVRYTQVAHRMPAAVNPQSTVHVADLSQLTQEFDVFVLDGFGVLNIGKDTIPGAPERVAQLQAMGKQVKVLTNGATLPVEKTIDKYAKWGMHFAPTDVISSRNALEHAIKHEDDQLLWGVIATDFAQIEKLAPKTLLLTDKAADYASVDGFIFLSSLDWTTERQAMLYNALSKNQRPVLVGNPDLVAPREDAMSLEPGLYAHELADAGICEPRFYGKPFSNVFDIVSGRINDVEPQRIAMVGDTLHTDILGGASYGWRTVLIKNHGLMKGADDERSFAQTGIRPDFVAATT